MKILFLHRNFPAQFRHLASYLANDPNNQVVFITNQQKFEIPGTRKLIYNLHREANTNIHHYLKFYEEAILHGQAALRSAIELKKQGFMPDIIIGHSWGPILFIKDLFPKVPLIGYFEWFYNNNGTDVDFGKKDQLSIDTEAHTRIRNSHLLVDLYTCDYGITPTKWQLKQIPQEFHNKISVIHDGIDTEFFKPDPNATLDIPGIDLNDAREIVTYATRGMEPYRGFPEFMKAAEIILKRRPDCHIVVAGEDRVCYGKKLPKGQSYKQLMLEELSLDISRIHFTGILPIDKYLNLLQISSVHIYLSYPFVLSWSMLEAMSTGCMVIGSNTSPVTEVIQDYINGVLVNFYSPVEIADKVDEVLNCPAKFLEMRNQARKTVIDKYNLTDSLSKQTEFINNMMVLGR